MDVQSLKKENKAKKKLQTKCVPTGIYNMWLNRILLMTGEKVEFLACIIISQSKWRNNKKQHLL